MPVDIISADEFSKMTAGVEKAPKTGDAEAGGRRRSPRQSRSRISTPRSSRKRKSSRPRRRRRPSPQPKKPDPKPAAAPPEPKQEAKAPDKQEPEQQKIDPIAEALKKDDAKKPDKKVENKPQPVKKPEPQQPKFDPRKVAALLDKRDPHAHGRGGRDAQQHRVARRAEGPRRAGMSPD